MYQLRADSSIIDPRLLEAFLREPQTRQRIDELKTGMSDSGLNLTHDRFKTLEVPLAPLAEQKRIADKLEAVLGRVDACRARLGRVPALLKRFRQSVLAAATSGKLTEEWRDTNECGEDTASLLERMAIERRAVHAKQGKNRKFREAEPVASEELPEIPTTWQWTNFDHCSSEISVGHVGPMKDRYVDKGVAFLRCQNVRPLRFNPQGLVCISTGFHKELSKSELCGGEILVVRSGANTGDCCVFPCGFGEANCSDLVITRPLSGLSSEYGAIYVNSPTGQSLLDQKQAGVAQPHFNIGAMRVKAFPLAPFAEQQEIVRRVEDLFAFADRIEARLASAQKTVERLTPSMLAKAFRGELVSQDPNDEPASALLERLNKQPVAKPARKARTKRP
jgi:type I restriction enzyme S subunit